MSGSTDFKISTSIYRERLFRDNIFILYFIQSRTEVCYFSCRGMPSSIFISGWREVISSDINVIMKFIDQHFKTKSRSKNENIGFCGVLGYDVKLSSSTVWFLGELKRSSLSTEGGGGSNITTFLFLLRQGTLFIFEKLTSPTVQIRDEILNYTTHRGLNYKSRWRKPKKYSKINNEKTKNNGHTGCLSRWFRVLDRSFDYIPFRAPLSKFHN